MADYLTRIDQALIYAPMRMKLPVLIDACVAAGAHYYATSGYRSYAEQDGLFAQGRTKPGSVVTLARGGKSYHNFGLAIDFARDGDIVKPGLQPLWGRIQYVELAKQSMKIGLEPGLYWHFVDPPHVQLPLSKHKIRLATLDKIHRDGGLLKVFDYLDAYSW